MGIVKHRLAAAAIALVVATAGAVSTGCGDDEGNDVTDAVERLQQEGEELRERADDARRDLDPDVRKEVEDAREEAEELREEAEKEAEDALDDYRY